MADGVGAPPPGLLRPLGAGLTREAGAPTPRWAGRPAAGAVVVLLAVLALGAWLRLRAIPGTWGADAVWYAERALDGGEASDPRSQRAVFLALVRAGLGLSDGRPEGAHWPALLASAGTVLVLFEATRRRAGPWIALLPAAIWAVLGLDVEEVADVSSDAVATFPAAVVALAIAASTQDPSRARRWLALGGLAAGAGVLVKETALFPAAGLVAGALLGGRGAERARRVAAAAVPAACVLGAAAALGVLQDAGIAASTLARAPEPVHADEPEFARRMLLGPLPALLTATGAFGLLHAAALPLAARTVVRALRGAPLAAAALVAFAAFWVAPVSFAPWGVLPDSLPRFLLPVLPLWFAALGETLAAPPADAWERRAAWAGAAAALPFLAHGPAAWIAVPPGVAACVATSLPDGFPGAALRRAAPAIACVALPAAAGLAFAAPLARTSPDPIWGAWATLPAAVEIHADRPIARRLQFAARTSPGADAARVVPFDGLPPADLAPGAVVLVARGSRADAACRGRGDLTAETADLGATAVWRRAR